MDERRPRCNKKVDDILLRKFLRISISGRLAPMVGISAMNLLFPTYQKRGFDFHIFTWDARRDGRFMGRTELILFLSKHVDQAIGPPE
jgi:hypothetical protein